MLDSSQENKVRKRKQFSVLIDNKVDNFIAKRQSQMKLDKKPHKHYFSHLLKLDGYETK